MLDDEPEAQAVLRVEAVHELDDDGLVLHDLERSAAADAIAVRRSAERLPVQRTGTHRLSHARAACPRDPLHPEYPEGVLKRVREIHVGAGDPGAHALQGDHGSSDRLQVGREVSGVGDNGEEFAPRGPHELDHSLVAGSLDMAGLRRVAENADELVVVLVAEVFEVLTEVNRGVRPAGPDEEVAYGPHRPCCTG